MSDLNEQEIRRLVEVAVQQLGKSANTETVNQVVHEAVHKIGPQTKPGPLAVGTSAQNRIIVTAFGKNRRGILAGITAVLSDNLCNIIDLNQKILHDFFTIMLLVDIAEAQVPFETLKQNIVSVGEELDLKVIIQHEEIFNTMHRV